MTALKPCPFCGGEAVGIEPRHGLGAHAFRCRKCAAEGTRCTNRDAAIDAWNRRVVDPALAAAEVLEEVERMIRAWLPNQTGPIDLTAAVANALARVDAHNPDTLFDRSDPDYWLAIAAAKGGAR